MVYANKKSNYIDFLPEIGIFAACNDLAKKDYLQAK